MVGTGLASTRDSVTLYAAYASNLDPARMGERCPHSPLRGTGWLEGWRLTFGGEEHGWDGALATIVRGPLRAGLRRGVRRHRRGRRCPRRLGVRRHRPLPQDQGARLTLDEEVVAWVYVLDAYEGGLPSASYLGVLADAAEAADAPADYVGRPPRAAPAGRTSAADRTRSARYRQRVRPRPTPTDAAAEAALALAEQTGVETPRRRPGDGLRLAAGRGRARGRRPPRSARPTCPASPRRPSTGHAGKIRSVRAGDAQPAGLPRPHPLLRGPRRARGRARRPHRRRSRAADASCSPTAAAGSTSAGPRHAGADQRPHQPHGDLPDRGRQLRRPHRPLQPAAARAVPGGRPDARRGRLRPVPRARTTRPRPRSAWCARSAATWSG